MKLKTLLATALLVVALPALAHAPKPLHGGRIVPAGDFHVEMVARDATVEVYLIDHNDKPVTLSGYKGLAILAAGGKSQRIVLEPAGGDLLSGKAEAALPKQPKGVVQITPPNGKVVSAKFN
jgi:hypothetical protein